MSKLSIPLDIPDVRVLDAKMNKKGDYIITVESTINSTTCQQCGREISQFHSHDRPITLRYLPILGHRVYIRLRPRSPHTKAYEEQVLFQLVNSTIQDVALKEGLGYEAVVGIVNRHVATQVEWGRVDRLGVIGLDEVALKKGRSDYPQDYQFVWSLSPLGSGMVK